jgi:hypothetical protein
MRLEIPKIIEKLKLSDYAEAWGDQTFDVWVNPTKEVNVLHDKNVEEANSIINKLHELKAARAKNGEEWSKSTGKTTEIELKAELEQVNKNALEWYSIIWSQGEEKNHVDYDEVASLFETAKESDPMFFQWLCEKTIELVIAHRVNRKN